MPHESSGMSVVELARLVVQMRAVQKRFFKGDNSSATVAEAKALERRVDEALRLVLTDQRQGTLFVGEAGR
jgi:hypothetical protein